MFVTYPDVQCLEVARLISGRRVACPPAVRATSFARRVDALSDQAPQATLEGSGFFGPFVLRGLF